MTEVVLRDLLRQAKVARMEADRQYLAMVSLAKRRGWSNAEIGRAVGVSEAAIRAYWRRNGSGSDEYGQSKSGMVQESVAG